jgi:hypothetical protein
VTYRKDENRNRIICTSVNIIRLSFGDCDIIYVIEVTSFVVVLFANGKLSGSADNRRLCTSVKFET